MSAVIKTTKEPKMWQHDFNFPIESGAHLQISAFSITQYQILLVDVIVLPYVKIFCIELHEKLLLRYKMNIVAPIF